MAQDKTTTARGVKAKTDLNPSKIWRIVSKSRQDAPAISFADFLDFEKNTHAGLIQDGKLSADSDFNCWLNKKYAKEIKSFLNGGGKVEEKDTNEGEQLNAGGKTIAGKLLNKAKDAIKDVATGGVTAPNANTPTEPVAGAGAGAAPYKSKNILGLKPVVAYSLGVVLVGSAILTGVLIYKNTKKKRG